MSALSTSAPRAQAVPVRHTGKKEIKVKIGEEESEARVEGGEIESGGNAGDSEFTYRERRCESRSQIVVLGVRDRQET
jgi:hypothetical protein